MAKVTNSSKQNFYSVPKKTGIKNSVIKQALIKIRNFIRILLILFMTLALANWQYEAHIERNMSMNKFLHLNIFHSPTSDQIKTKNINLRRH